MRYCRLRNKKGGAKPDFSFDKPESEFSGAGQALDSLNKQQQIENKANSKILQTAGGDITVPTMSSGGKDGNAGIKTGVQSLVEAEYAAEGDTPPPIEGGRRKTRRKKKKNKKGRRLTKICVKKCTRKCYTPKRGGKRRKSRRKKNRKKRTRRRGGVRSPSKKTPPKKKQPKSPPRKPVNWEKHKPVNWEKHKPKLKKIIETFTTLDKPDPNKLVFKRRGPLRHVPTTPRAKQKAEFLRMQENLRESAKVFQTPKRGGKHRKTRKRMRKRKRKKTRK